MMSEEGWMHGHGHGQDSDHGAGQRQGSGCDDACDQEHLITRRGLLKGAVALGASAFFVGMLGNVDEGVQEGHAAELTEAERRDAQWGFLMRPEKCVGCNRCVESCSLHNHIAEDAPKRRTILTYYDAVGRELHASIGCMHCAQPACVEVCPAQAVRKGDGGLVVVDKDLCIGCKYCYQACPFGIPHYTSEGMDKCDCCQGAGVALGDTPYCVRACMTGALKFGRLDDFLAEDPDLKLMDAPTEPSYIFA